MPLDLLPSLGEEQRMLLDASVRFMEDRFPLAAVRERADRWEPIGRDYVATAGELGWLGLLAGEDHGGGSASGNGLVDAALVAAERGARLQPGPYPGHCTVVELLSRAEPERHREVLADLVAGRGWATWAFSEERAVRLARTADGLRLEGTVRAVADAADCSWLLVTADGPDGTTQILLPTDAPGLEVSPAEGLDVTRSWCTVALDGVRAGDDQVVGQPGPRTDEHVSRQVQVAAVLTAAESVGAMDADFAMALQYAKDRIAFGRPIGSFQAIKHLLADTSLWLEMAKGLVATAAEALGSGSPEGPAAAHSAKSFVGEKGVELAQNCFQVFGGIGYTWEHDQHFFLRRLAADAAGFGSPAWHRSRMLEEEAVG